MSSKFLSSDVERHQRPVEDGSAAQSEKSGSDVDLVSAVAKGGHIDDSIVEKLADELGKDVPGYDPSLEWTEAEENKIVWLLDTRIMPWVLLSTFILNVDRTNISNAISDNLPANLGFDNTVVNNATSVYAVFFSLFTFSGAVLAKKFGPHRVIPGLMFAWGLVTLAHALIKDALGYYFVRIFIAITEGGVIPATLVYLGGYYKSTELATRLSWFWGVQSVASAISGLMSAAILKMSGIGGLYGWKWLFILDGILTVVVAFLLVAVLPAHSTKTIIFNDREAKIAATRVIREDPVKKYYEQTVRWSDVYAAFIDSRLWGHLIITLLGLTALTPLGTYLPTLIKSFGFNVYISNVLTAPGYILGFISMTIMTTHSDKTRERGYHGVFSASWLLLGFILLRVVPDNTNKYALWAVLLFIYSWPMTHPMNISWMTEHMAPLGKRTVGSAAIIASANIYAVYAGQIYQQNDAPRYHNGNLIIIGFLLATVVAWLVFRKYLEWINNTRQAKWDALSEKEKENYLATTTDVGNDRLDFRFTL
ncbi:MFS general substrate transporter [Zopfochytrium polystomum]|nr:MFS general substrate transporter [Zopfochytrium polystomum]